MATSVNTRGFQVDVMPQYSPITVAPDYTGVLRGVSEGLGTVQQFQNARRLRQVMDEEQADRPVRQRLRQLQLGEAEAAGTILPDVTAGRRAAALRQLAEATGPVAEVSEVGLVTDENGNLVRETFESWRDALTQLPVERPATGPIRREVVRTAAQLAQDQMTAEALANYRQNLGTAAVERANSAALAAANPRGIPMKLYDANTGTTRAVVASYNPQTGTWEQQDIGQAPPTQSQSSGGAMSEVLKSFGLTPPGTTAPAPAAAQPAAAPAPIVAPNAPAGGVPNFRTEAEMQEAVRMGIVQIGQEVMVNGVPGVVGP